VRRATIGYARRASHAADVAAQARSWVRIDDRALVNFDEPQRYELGIPSEGKSCELVGVVPGANGLFSRDQLQGVAIVAALAAPGPHYVYPPDDPSVGPAARLFSWVQSFYWDDARSVARPLGQVGSLTLPHHEETACFAPIFAANVLGARVSTDAQIAALGYMQRSALWWQADAVRGYASPAGFSMPVSLVRGDGATTQLVYDAYQIAIERLTDPLGNLTVAEIDFCQLAPWRLTDPNGNVVEVRYDPLGVVVATTSYGHAGAQPWGFDALSSVAAIAPATLDDAVANPGQYLQSAASFRWYDLGAWSGSGMPTTVLTLTAEQLSNNGAGGVANAGRIQIGVDYVDGLGRTLQAKMLVEPGPAIQRDAQGKVVVDANGNPVLVQAQMRWRVSGHVVYDTKEHPGRIYEPFFSPSPAYEGDDVLQHIGVSLVSLYDAIGRSVGQHFPDGTFSTTTFGAWTIQQADPNDNVVGSAYGAFRKNLPVDNPERQAYLEAVPHAATPVLTYLDPLGRLTGSLAEGGSTAADRRTETLLDIAGPARQVTDPRGLVAFLYQRDMLGRAFLEQSVDAGNSWNLPDGYGRLATMWDDRGFQTVRGYDLADRPLFTHVLGGEGATPLDAYVEQWTYGESLANHADAAQRNLLGRVVTVNDSAGEVVVNRYDPTGCVMALQRTLRAWVDPGPTGIPEPDWRTPVALEPVGFTSTAVYDALGRPVTDTLPDGTVRAYAYLQSGPLSQVLVTTPDGSLTSAPIVASASYGARGEQLTLGLGNGVQVVYGYDAQSHRLATQTATLGARPLQSLQHTWDPVGNLVRLVDNAQQGPSPLISGLTVPARRDYTYDAHYRVLSAIGRVHQALLQYDYVPGAPGAFMCTRRINLNDGTAIEQFTETYAYDAAGNLTTLKHVGRSQSWTTNMWVSTTSNRAMPALDPNGIPVSNPESRFDLTGNITRVSHLRLMEWTFRGALGHTVVIQRPGGTDDAERYVYGADGMRVRKVTTQVVNNGQLQVTEKVYFGDSERKRITVGGVQIVERWTTHVGDGGQRVALVHRWTRDDQAREVDDVTKPHLHYQLNTHWWSSALELDGNGQVISYEEYFPYGGTAFIAGNDVREVGLKEYRYSGKECDGFSGLYYYGYRYYAPWMGRWLSPDPIGSADDLNLYLFVLGNPTSLVDGLGLDTGDEVHLKSEPLWDPYHSRFLREGDTVEFSIVHKNINEAGGWHTSAIVRRSDGSRFDLEGQAPQAGEGTWTERDIPAPPLRAPAPPPRVPDAAQHSQAAPPAANAEQPATPSAPAALPATPTPATAPSASVPPAAEATPTPLSTTHSVKPPTDGSQAATPQSQGPPAPADYRPPPDSTAVPQGVYWLNDVPGDAGAIERTALAALASKDKFAVGSFDVPPAGRTGDPATDLRHDLNREFLKAGLLPLSNPGDTPTAFETHVVSVPHSPYFPIYDPSTGDVTSYRKDAAKYHEVRNREGKTLRSGEFAIEKPLVDPIDIAPAVLTGGISLLSRLSTVGVRASFEAGFGAIFRTAITDTEEEVESKLVSVAPELPSPIATAGPRATIAVGDLGRIGAVTSKKTFRRLLTSMIQDRSHPLHRLLNAAGKLTPSTTRGMTELDWFENPNIIEAGHWASAKGLAPGVPDRLVVMSAYENRLLSATVERARFGGEMLEGGKVLAIGGVPVDFRTAVSLVEYGTLRPEVFANAPMVVY
jgi:RHS repeat-associated protein